VLSPLFPLLLLKSLPPSWDFFGLHRGVLSYLPATQVGALAIPTLLI
jgi:hypothetical protein